MLVANLPPDAATQRAVHPAAAWSTGDYLLALAVDHLAAANWQRSGDKHATRPTPLPRPGAEPEGIGTAIPLAEMRALARQWNAGELARPDTAPTEAKLDRAR